MATLSRDSKKNIFRAIILGGTLTIAESLARFTCSYILPEYERTRQLLAGEPCSQFTSVLATGQAYLCYIPSPNYRNESGVQHNRHGYRGKLVPLQRTPNVARILCLGGSTTYGWGSPRADETYPAYLEQILANSMPKEVSGVEVINGGVYAATTAEIMTHYLFKWHYYNPDLVIINPGGNDAMSLELPNYHPDSSHSRKPLIIPEPVSRGGRILLKSRLLSIALINFLYGKDPNVIGGGNTKGEFTPPPAAQWYEKSPTSYDPKGWKKIPKKDISFNHNMDVICREIKQDGAKILLVPFREGPRWTKFRSPEILELEHTLLEEMRDRFGLGYAPFPSEVISPDNWTDNCHNNPAGCKQKAAYLARYVRYLLGWGPT